MKSSSNKIEIRAEGWMRSMTMKGPELNFKGSGDTVLRVRDVWIAFKNGSIPTNKARTDTWNTQRPGAAERARDTYGDVETCLTTQCKARTHEYQNKQGANVKPVII